MLPIFVQFVHEENNLDTLKGMTFPIAYISCEIDVITSCKQSLQYRLLFNVLPLKILQEDIKTTNYCTKM